MQILVVEDSPVYRQLLASHLQEWGFPFTIAKNGTEAWTLLQRSDCPRLILLDWVLPDIDGIELCRRIRLAGSGNSYSYIILLTGKDGKKNMLEAMQAGADDYLVKPFDQLELKARLLVGKRIIGLNEELVSARESMRYATEKQLHLRSAALEAAANGIVITDRHGTIVWANHAFTKMTGYSKEEILGQNPRLLKSGKQPESYYANLWSTISSGRVWQGEIVNRRKDGTTYTEEMTITPVTQDLGSMTDTYFIAIKQDITERKQAQQALRHAEEKYRAIFEDAVVGIFQTTPDGCPLSVNRAYAEMLGYDSPEQLLAEVSNVALQLFVDPGRMGELRHALDENDIVRGAEVEVHRRDRTKKWVLVNFRAVRDDGGNIVLQEGTVEDITDRKIAEEQVPIPSLLRCSYGAAQSDSSTGSIVKGTRQCSSAKGQSCASVPRSRRVQNH